MPPIPESSGAQELGVPGTKIIPKGAAEFPKEEDDVEAIPYKISFESYVDDECEINGMKKQNAAVALKIVRDIGVHFTNESNLRANSNCINDIKPIFRSGDYLRVCKGLEEDIEVREIKYTHIYRREPQNNVDIRLFFYTLEKERTFYIRAIRQSHYNLR